MIIVTSNIGVVYVLDLITFMDRSRPAIITTHAHNTAINIQRVEWSDTSIKKYHVARLIDSSIISINLSNK